jgi:hypothetical protein
VTKPATNLAPVSASLNATLTPNARGSAHFALQAIGGSSRSIAEGVLTGLTPITLSKRVSGLSPGTRYRYSLVFVRFDGTTTSSARSFTTPRH